MVLAIAALALTAATKARTRDEIIRDAHAANDAYTGDSRPLRQARLERGFEIIMVAQPHWIGWGACRRCGRASPVTARR